MKLEYIKNETINTGERIECYFSRVKNKISIRKLNCQSDYFNRIVAHAEMLHLGNVEFVYRGNRVIVRGDYVGTLPFIPDTNKMIIENRGKFYSLDGKMVNAASYCVIYRNLIIAEGCYLKNEKQKTV